MVIPLTPNAGRQLLDGAFAPVAEHLANVVLSRNLAHRVAWLPFGLACSRASVAFMAAISREVVVS